MLSQPSEVSITYFDARANALCTIEGKVSTGEGYGFYGDGNEDQKYTYWRSMQPLRITNTETGEVDYVEPADLSRQVVDEINWLLQTIQD